MFGDPRYPHCLDVGNSRALTAVDKRAGESALLEGYKHSLWPRLLRRSSDQVLSGPKSVLSKANRSTKARQVKKTAKRHVNSHHGAVHSQGQHQRRSLCRWSASARHCPAFCLGEQLRPTRSHNITTNDSLVLRYQFNSILIRLAADFIVFQSACQLINAAVAVVSSKIVVPAVTLRVDIISPDTICPQSVRNGALTHRRHSLHPNSLRYCVALARATRLTLLHRLLGSALPPLVDSAHVS
ncbi:hypothetical protein BKA81DRAFT_376520 [Phyllosticta paracitricarpa]|uniref:Uncharacterized protein n=1 Tax=Phyllosticta citricarpa TaxID=55181 RepID=A0ABR1M7B3_9PEZI